MTTAAEVAAPPGPAARGACLCGTVTFEIAPPYRWFAHCHCSMCRKHHGALFGTGLGVARQRFRWLSGTDDIVHYRATAAFERPFCRHCGSTVPAESGVPDVVHVPAGMLEGDVGERPRTHIFVASKATCFEITDSLPQFAAYPPGVDLPVVADGAPAAPGDKITGSCLCGSVGFELDGTPETIVNCHCSLCRRSRGAAFGSTLLTTLGRFRWLRGRDRARAYRLPQPRHYQVDFCTRCGSLVPSVARGIGLALLPAGAIDTPLPPLPMVHIYVGSKAPWYEIGDRWPQFTELPPPERFGEFFR
jgi:hypothetical protein